MRICRDNKANTTQTYEGNVVPVISLNDYPPVLGSVVFSVDTSTPYYADGTQWFSFGGASSITSFSAGATGLTPSAPSVGPITLGGTVNVSHGGTGVTTITNGGIMYGNGSSAVGSIQGTSGQLLVSGGALSPSWSGSIIYNGSTLTGIPTPTNINDAANKSYVDAATAGLNVHDSVAVATTGALTATYFNGASGVGATLTNAGPQAALVIDGVTVSLGNRVLVKNQVAQTQNGVYDVTNVGSGSTNWVLTRSADFDNTPPGEIMPGDFVFVVSGTVNGSTGWIQTNDGTGPGNSIIIGTDPINFTQFSGAGTYLAGTGLLLTGNTFSNTGVLTVSGGGTGLAFSPSSGNAVLSGTLNPANGGTGLDTSTATNGQLLIGNGSGMSLGTLTAGTGVGIVNSAGGITINNGGVTSFSAGTTGFTPNVSSTGAVTLAGTLNPANGGTGLNTSGATNGQLLIGNGSGLSLGTLTAGTGVGIVNSAGGITINNNGVTSFSAGTTGFTPSVSSTGAVTLAGTLNPANGGTGLNTSTATNGQLLIGNGTGLSLSTLTAGTGVGIVNSAGGIQINNNGVTSFSAGTTGFTPSVSSTGAVTLAGTLGSANGGTGLSSIGTANQVLGVNIGGTALEYKTIAGGTGISIVPTAGVLTINNTFVTPVLDSAATPTYPTDLTKGVWYGLNTKANAFDSLCVTLGSNADTNASGAIAIGNGAVASGISIGAGAASAAGTISLGSSANSTAGGIAIGPSTSTGISGCIAIGGSASTPGGVASVALGPSASAGNGAAVAIGNGAASRLSGVAIGSGASAVINSSGGSVAVGAGATANDQNCVSVGGSSSAILRSVCVGYLGSSNTQGVSLGYNARSGVNAVSIGTNATTTAASSSISIGTGSSATAASAVALGASIVADQIGGVFLQHRGPSAFTVNAAGFIAGTNELVEVSSSIRTKENIRTLENTEDKFSKLHPVRYTPKLVGGITESEIRENIGLIAEEVVELYPEIVTFDTENRPAGLMYDRLVSVLIERVQMQQSIINKMAADIEMIKASLK